jgi:hypothetical protein
MPILHKVIGSLAKALLLDSRTSSANRQTEGPISKTPRMPCGTWCKVSDVNHYFQGQCHRLFVYMCFEIRTPGDHFILVRVQDIWWHSTRSVYVSCFIRNHPRFVMDSSVAMTCPATSSQCRASPYSLQRLCSLLCLI